MDRLNVRTLAACGLGLILAASGCRNTPTNAVPHRQFTDEVTPLPTTTAGFGSAPHAPTGPTFPGSPGSSGVNPSAAGSGAFGPATAGNPYDPSNVPNPYGTSPSPYGSSSAADSGGLSRTSTSGLSEASGRPSGLGSGGLPAPTYGPAPTGTLPAAAPAQAGGGLPATMEPVPSSPSSGASASPLIPDTLPSSIPGLEGPK